MPYQGWLITLGFFILKNEAKKAQRGWKIAGWELSQSYDLRVETMHWPAFPTNKKKKRKPRELSQKPWILGPGCIICLFYELGNMISIFQLKNLYFLNLGIMIFISFFIRVPVYRQVWRSPLEMVKHAMSMWSYDAMLHTKPISNCLKSSFVFFNFQFKKWVRGPLQEKNGTFLENRKQKQNKTNPQNQSVGQECQ